MPISKADTACESVLLLKTADSSNLCDAPLERRDELVGMTNNDKKADSIGQSDVCNTNNTPQPSDDYDGQPRKDEESDHESDEKDTDQEVNL